MKEIVRLNLNDIHLLREFLEKAGSSLKTFRYFNKRPVEVISGHLITLLIISDDIPVCYGHLEPENDKVWLGISVLESARGKGYGNDMMNALINFAKENKVECIHLSVDDTNIPAIALYHKFGFQLQKQEVNILYYSLPL